MAAWTDCMDASRHGFSSMHEAVVVMNTREREREQDRGCSVTFVVPGDRNARLHSGQAPWRSWVLTFRTWTAPLVGVLPSPQRCGGRVSSEGRGRRSTGQADTGCGETPENVWQRSNMLDILRKVSNTTKPKTCGASGDLWTSGEVFPPGFARNSLKPRSYNFVHLTGCPRAYFESFLLCFFCICSVNVRHVCHFHFIFLCVLSSFVFDLFVERSI